MRYTAALYFLAMAFVSHPSVLWRRSDVSASEGDISPVEEKGERRARGSSRLPWIPNPPCAFDIRRITMCREGQPELKRKQLLYAAVENMAQLSTYIRIYIYIFIKLKRGGMDCSTLLHFSEPPSFLLGSGLVCLTHSRMLVSSIRMKDGQHNKKKLTFLSEKNFFFYCCCCHVCMSMGEADSYSLGG